MDQHQQTTRNDEILVCLQGNDKRVLAAAAEIIAKGLAEVTLLGKPDEVEAEARRMGLDLSACQVIDHHVCALLATCVMVFSEDVPSIVMSQCLQLCPRTTRVQAMTSTCQPRNKSWSEWMQTPMYAKFHIKY